MEKTRIKQKWFHFYDEITSDSSNKKIRYVLDFYTNENYFCFNLKDINFSNLNIKSRNINSELAYVDYNEFIKISLGPMDRYPSVYIDDCEYKHVKLEIEYIFLDPIFEKKGHFSAYKSNIFFNETSHPEFHINIPKGLTLNLNSVVYSAFDKENILIDYFEYADQDLFLRKDNLNNRFTFILSPNNYDHILKNEFSSFSLEYSVENDKKYFLIPSFAILTTLLSCIELISVDLLVVPFVALISFVVLYLNLEKENYVYPLKHLTSFLILTSVIFLLSKSIIYLFLSSTKEISKINGTEIFNQIFMLNFSSFLSNRVIIAIILFVFSILVYNKYFKK